MSTWTHLIRFRAKEDGQVHLGQLVDTSRDVGLDCVDGVEVKAFLINGDMYNGTVTEKVLTVDHEGGFPIPNDLEVFTKPRTALAGPFPAAVTIPKCAQDGSSDYEAELCVVIGKTGRDIPENRALEYVLGYTAANDVSARNLQLAVKQWSFSKGLDNSCPIVLVSPSAIHNPQSLDIKAIYDGQTVQDGNTANMIFSVEKQISCLSRGTTLEAGSIILTGTPAGIGYFRDPRVSLENGGRIDVQIEKIGTLVNMVNDSLSRHARIHGRPRDSLATTASIQVLRDEVAAIGQHLTVQPRPIQENGLYPDVSMNENEAGDDLNQSVAASLVLRDQRIAPAGTVDMSFSTRTQVDLLSIEEAFENCGDWSDLDLLMFEDVIHQPSRLVGESIGIDALASCVPASGPLWEQAWEPTEPLQDEASDQTNGGDAMEIPSSSIKRTIRDQWYTRPTAEAAYQYAPTPLLNRKDHVDEAYRAGLQYRLHPRPRDEVLPSADFLWEVYLYRGGYESLAVAQAVALSQTFRMLSRNSNDLLMTDSFHGTIISWARQTGMFQVKTSLPPKDSTSAEELEKAWISWSRAEETVRFLLALHIHDYQFAAIFHHDPILRHESANLPRCSPDELFVASRASEWHTKHKALRSCSPLSESQLDDFVNWPVVPEFEASLNAYAALTGISANICEGHYKNKNEEMISGFRCRLMSWYASYSPDICRPCDDPQCLMVLWHEAFMLLYVSFDWIERVVGRDGTLMTPDDLARTQTWVAGLQGQRCAIHAMLIHKRLKELPISAEPAIHVPKALFYSALVIYCHVKFRSVQAPDVERDRPPAPARPLGSLS
ncbi:bifunctional 4-hydroxyphenylacetate degradation enzyme [Fusarium beomiforme]|uniref:Bifunctional 4-hydroxyphenylacetate degradation enzyme n=1 Tax=Fusarium beomiforme TaxID=44412 RepID=A0A9P5ADZ2_9HYPO|nr:bifunctional 4-hydroxyphenylacetate degradation enzyme [Fusarium beomiforme]